MAIYLFIYLFFTESKPNLKGNFEHQIWKKKKKAHVGKVRKQKGMASLFPAGAVLSLDLELEPPWEAS